MGAATSGGAYAILERMDIAGPAFWASGPEGWSGSFLGHPGGIYHFENITVGVLEKEALEGGLANGINKFGPVCDEAFLQGREFYDRIVECKVAPELGLER